MTLHTLIRGLVGRSPADEDLAYRAAGLTVGDAALPPEGGIVVGSKPGRSSTALYDTNELGVMAIGPCRSHKTAGLVIPTLLTWRGSAVISDIAGELYEHTAAWRSIDAGNRIIHFAPGAAGSRDKFNPLDIIRVGSDRAGRDAAELAERLIPDAPRSAGMMWLAWARAYLVRYLLIEASRKGTLAAIHAAVCNDDPSMPIDARGVDEQHPVVWGEIKEASRALAGLDLHDKALAAVRVMVIEALAPFAAPEIVANTASSTFTIDELVDGERPASLYLVCAPHDMRRLEPLHRLLIDTITSRLTERDTPPTGHSLLLMLDSFCDLGRLPFFEQAVAYLRKHRIRPFVVIQDLPQLERLYGPDSPLVHFPGSIVALRPSGFAAAQALDANTNGKLGEPTLMMLGNREAQIMTPYCTHVVPARVPAYYTDEPFKSRSK